MSDSNGAKWYVAHTYSGYENKVKANIEATVQSRNMEDVILEVVVPMYDVEETKNGERKIVSKKIFPSYVLVNMYMTDESWYVVRNTRGVTGFVGPASKPVPLTDKELAGLGIKTAAQASSSEEAVAPAPEPKPPVQTIDVKVGDPILITDGSFSGNEGTVEEINMDRHKIKASIFMFNTQTIIELDFSQIKKIEL